MIYTKLWQFKRAFKSLRHIKLVLWSINWWKRIKKFVRNSGRKFRVVPNCVLEPAKKQRCKMDVSEYIIFTDIMKAVLAFAWIMYLWEAYIARRQVNGAAFSNHRSTEYFVILDKMMTPHWSAMSLIQCRSRPKSSSYMIMPNKVFHIEQHIHVAHATLFAFHLVVLL